MLVAFVVIFLFMMSSDAVEMIKQFPESVLCSSLSFIGDVVYIGSHMRVIQWHVSTDSVVILEGYPGLILFRNALLSFILP
jgi:hypothetical protein